MITAWWARACERWEAFMLLLEYPQMTSRDWFVYCRAKREGEAALRAAYLAGKPGISVPVDLYRKGFRVTEVRS